MPRRIKRRRFEAVTPTLAELQTKLESVRREVRNLTVMGMDPNQTAEQTALIKDLEQSARAELRLRMMALEYAQGELRSRRRQRGQVRTLSAGSTIDSGKALVPPMG
jgi:hypothetical protein